MIVGTGGYHGPPEGRHADHPEPGNDDRHHPDGLSIPRAAGLSRLAPLTHAAGVLCFPVLASGGEVVVMPQPDLAEFLGPGGSANGSPTPSCHRHLIYMLLGHPALEHTNLTSLQCFWYGAAPMSATRLAEALTRIGPVMAQLFGQTEAPMMISMLPPADHFDA